MTRSIVFLASIFLLMFTSDFTTMITLASDSQCGPNASVKTDPDCTSDCCPVEAGQPSPCPDPCATACKCDLMYRRANGTCIPARDCPAIKCPKNEEFVSCPNRFCSENCSNAREYNPANETRCKFVGRIGITVICDPGCQCIDEYWRNKAGKCVSYNNCKCG